MSHNSHNLTFHALVQGCGHTFYARASDTARMQQR